ncbi:MAG: nuclear transport factor 2 family protein [Burkholderiaceae bacterium]
MADTEADVERLCTQLAFRYARATDLGDAAAAGTCFTEDGQLHMPGGRSFQGRSAIAQRIAEQPPDQVSRHVLTNICIEVPSPGRATGTLTLTMYRAKRTQPSGPLPLEGPALVGEYQDEYRLTPQGWRIASRRLTTIFRRSGA